MIWYLNGGLGAEVAVIVGGGVISEEEPQDSKKIEQESESELQILKRCTRSG